MSHEENMETFQKICISWLGALYSYLTLDRIAVLLTIAYTAFNLYVLLRDEVFNKKG